MVLKCKDGCKEENIRPCYKGREKYPSLLTCIKCDYIVKEVAKNEYR
jgi:hypothetical protein|tara:strand:+ start:699 stop:839 length:141 start_codon:yes stop_codon:yes gene_type:complete